MHWFLKFIFGIKLYMFQTVPLSIISSFSPYTQQWYMSYSLWAGSGRNVQDQDRMSCSCSQAVSKPVWHIPVLCVHWKTPDDGQRNCPKHVEFYSKNKFEKISASSWFYYKNLSRCAVTWMSNLYSSFVVTSWWNFSSNCTNPFGKQTSTLCRTVICTWVPFRGIHKSQVIFVCSFLYCKYILIHALEFISCVLQTAYRIFLLGTLHIQTTENIVSLLHFGLLHVKLFN